ncbi:2,4-dihydroxyhept-2-ene-1,7-dioic acid aldolase [Caproiciproducens sp. AGMB10547]|uniref:2,4-dihydroxyhept-2-ene-1,7-dioic acid aldolase n=2 Tax=Caproiciproducens faecalis TaxID=2820301 RepID=A0ABS7DJD6_9FIRM|nr:2,4-dihydroxyhept-2-ene-1,7-dioic acid aldolase [Caproiciproducens faecalis]
MKENRLRYLLNHNLPSVSTRLLSTWPLITEAVGSTSNFDYIEFVAEYSPFNQSDMENICRAAELNNMSSMIKVDFQNRAFVAQKALASGFQAVLFTDHKTAEEVKETMFVIRPDTPEDKGRFGRPNRRFVGFSQGIPQMDYAKMVRDTVVAIMIEKKEALDNLDEICSVPGVDMVQFGPSDYSMSKGWNAGEHVSEYKAAERKMIEIALKHGVQPRCEINAPEEAQYYLDLGVKHFCLGDELRTNLNYWKNSGGALRTIVDSLK